MATITRDRLHELVDALADTHLEAAGQLLAALANEAPLPEITIEPAVRASARQRIANTGRPPLSADAFAMDFWPAEQSADALVETINRWRREGGDA